jgi:aminoglycoside phosphotransferase (APT) family kinase protein
VKARWPRQQPRVALTAAQASALLAPILPNAEVVEVAPCGDGLMNSNLRVELAGRDAPLLLRIYQRVPSELGKEAAIARLLEDRLPVARFLYSSDDNPVTGHPYAIVEWIEGDGLESLLPRLDEAALVQLGGAIGAALGEMHGIAFPRYGFFRDGLELPEAIDLDRAGILAFLRACLSEGPARARLGAALSDQLETFMEGHGGIIDDWLPPPCLVHGDFNPPNLLVRRDPATGGWRLAAILDWEFALSGTPGFDFGNLLRPPLGVHEGFVQALAQGYRAAGRDLPNDWQRIARLIDLTAWTEMLSRHACPAEVIADAQAIVRATLAEEAA